jgi:hypothetical protein
VPFNLNGIMSVTLCINTLPLSEINQYLNGLKCVSFIVMEQLIWKFVRGYHKKGFTTFNATEVSLQQKIMLQQQKCIFLTAERRK